MTPLLNSTADGRVSSLLEELLAGIDLDGKFVVGLGRERLDGDVELGGGTGGDGLVTGHVQRGGLGDIVGAASLEGEFVAGKVDVVGTDDVLRSGEGDGADRQRLVRRIGHVDGDDGRDLLHGDLGNGGRGDILRHAVNGHVRAGEMGHVVETGLGLRLVGGAAEGQIARVRVRGGLDVRIVRIQQIPVVGVGGESRRTGGVVRGGVIDLELAVLGIVRGAGGGVEDVERVAVDPLGSQTVVNGAGCGIRQHNLHLASVAAEEIGFLVTTGKGKDGGGQSRKEKDLFHEASLR
jgi:hypothetical protein